jgi:hypothetical protein
MLLLLTALFGWAMASTILLLCALKVGSQRQLIESPTE